MTGSAQLKLEIFKLSSDRKHTTSPRNQEESEVIIKLNTARHVAKTLLARKNVKIKKHLEYLADSTKLLYQRRTLGGVQSPDRKSVV